MQEINRKRWSRSSGREKQKEDLNGRARPPDYREYQLSQKEWMQYLIMGAGAAGLCAYTFYRSVLAFLFLLPVAFLYPVYKKKDLEKERTDDEFMAMYEQYEAFDDLEEAYLDMEEQVTTLVASYVDNHLELFAKIIK